MAKNNLRVVYQNLVDLDTTTITASSTQSATTSTANLKKDAKGSVWRSATKTTGNGTTVKAYLLVDFGSTTSGANINSIILPYTNLNSSTASIRVYGYTSPPTLSTDVNNPTATGGTLVASFTLTTTTSAAAPSARCCPWNTLDLKNWNNTTTGGANTYAYGGGTSARIWLPTSFNALSCRYLLLEITDSYTYSGTVSTSSTLNGAVLGANTLFLNTFKPGDSIFINSTPSFIGTVQSVESNTALTLAANNSFTSSGVTYGAVNLYIEASRLIIGRYWSPKYNTDYGLSNTVKDMSTHDRTDAGDLITKRGPRYSTLSFDLKWLDQSDRIELTKLLIGSGISKPVFISLFPDNTDTGLAVDYEKERAHQCYGKMVQIPGVSYSTLDMYSTQIEIEEV